MFTGIVERGEVVETRTNRIVVRSPGLADCDLGASVAVNGVCLTVTESNAGGCMFDVLDETLARTALGDLKKGSRVNVERPVRAGAELGGHIVQGHVDGVGVIRAVVRDGEDTRARIGVPDGLDRYIVEKGSVTVDGISLTVASINGDAFEVVLIPTTIAVTTLGEAQVGYRVNLEVDVLAKYVEKITHSGNRGKG